MIKLRIVVYCDVVGRREGRSGSRLDSVFRQIYPSPDYVGCKLSHHRSESNHNFACVRKTIMSLLRMTLSNNGTSEYPVDQRSCSLMGPTALVSANSRRFNNVD